MRPSNVNARNPLPATPTPSESEVKQTPSSSEAKPSSSNNPSTISANTIARDRFRILRNSGLTEEKHSGHTVGELGGLARTIFGKTTGRSPNIDKYYETNPDLLKEPLTKERVAALVKEETEHASRPPKVWQDTLARRFGPIRGPIAHSIAFNATVIGQPGGVDKEIRTNAHGYKEEAEDHRIKQHSPFGE